MIVRHSASEADMIAHFLRYEYAHTERYGARLDACIAAEGANSSVISCPDLRIDEDNVKRRRIFSRYRGYGTGQPSYLTGFPAQGIAWQWVSLSPEEVLETRYIRYVEWSELSAGTRSPRVAAARIRAHEVDGERFMPLRTSIRAGNCLPAPILVTTHLGAPTVILEGHSRITAYALEPEFIPAEVVALLGTSPDIAQWDEF